MGNIKFGTDGWRGIIAEEFTFKNIEAIARATGTFAIERWNAGIKGVAVGYDTRFLSPEAAERVAKTLKDQGIPVHLSRDFVPTPILSYNVKERGWGGGIMITASHNPYIFNGFKIKTPQGGSAPTEVTKEVEDRVKRDRASSTREKQGEIIREDLLRPYLSWIAKAVELKRLKDKVVSDPIYGAVRGLFRDILLPLKIEVEVICEERNPSFGGRNPEPIESNLAPLLTRVKAHQGEAIGIANDGDGDRVCMVDEAGRFVSPHQIFALILDHMRRNKGMKGTVVKTFSTTSLIEKMCQDFGLELHETSIGFKYISPLMLEKDVLIAGEESGGIGVKGHIPERDGIFSPLLVLEKMCWEGKRLTELIDDLERRYGPHHYKRRDLHIFAEKGKEMVEIIAASPPSKLAGKTVESLKHLDGLKIFIEGGGWLLLRASGTEPLLRLYSESSSIEEVEALLDEGERLIFERRG